MFTNLRIYRAGGDMPSSDALRAALQLAPFIPCAPTQPSTFGWVPPRGEENGDLLECIGGHWIACLQMEARILPSPVVKRRVAELAAKVEEDTGRKPKGKRLKELKEQAVMELLPKAFTKQRRVLVWIYAAARLMVIDTSSSSKADDVARALIAAAGKMNVSALETETAPATAMALWLTYGDVPDTFTIDRECELKQPDGEKAVVRYCRHTLELDEIREHIRQGKLPTQVAMTWDGRVSFTLTEDLTIKSVTMLDVVLEDAATKDGADKSGFDADVAIATGELSQLLADLVDALGGARVLPIEAAAGAGDAPAPHDDAATDPVYPQAVAIVKAEGKPSISLVQRHLRIGYNRAARLLERMEAEGLVSPMGNDGARTLTLAGAQA